MKEQTQGLVISLLIHGFILACIGWVSASAVKVSLPIGIDFGLVQQGSSSPVQKQVVVREHTVEHRHIVEQPQIYQPVQPSITEAEVPVQEPKQMAAVESSPVGSADMT